jgi:hypothetical protein
MIRRVFIRARQQFGLQPKDIDIRQLNMNFVEVSYDLATLNGTITTEWKSFQRQNHFPLLSSREM